MSYSERFKNVVDLASDIIDMNSCLENMDLKVELYRLKTAKYKALFYHKDGIYEKISKQLSENFEATYHMGSLSTYRTLENMRNAGLLTQDEYDFCNEED